MKIKIKEERKIVPKIEIISEKKKKEYREK
jgi:hypothetical protein